MTARETGAGTSWPSPPTWAVEITGELADEGRRVVVVRPDGHVVKLVDISYHPSERTATPTFALVRTTGWRNWLLRWLTRPYR